MGARLHSPHRALPELPRQADIITERIRWPREESPTELITPPRLHELRWLILGILIGAVGMGAVLAWSPGSEPADEKVVVEVGRVLLVPGEG